MITNGNKCAIKYSWGSGVYGHYLLDKFLNITTEADQLFVIEKRRHRTTRSTFTCKRQPLFLTDSSRREPTFNIIPFDGKIVRASLYENGSICVIDSNNNLWVYGKNANGVLGLGDVVEVNIFTPVLPENRFRNVSVGQMCTLAIDMNGNLWFAGRLTNKSTSRVFTQLTNGINFINVSMKYVYCLAVDSNGDLYGCGSDFVGMLGIGGNYDSLEEFSKIKENTGFKTVNTLGYFSLCVDFEGDVWASGFRGDELLGVNMPDGEFPKISQGARIKYAVGGADQILLLGEDGTVFFPSQLIDWEQFPLTK